MKYVFDTLAAGRNWHKPDQRPDGAPFVYMNEAEANYTEYAAKGRRLISKGYAADCSLDGMKLAYSSGAIGASGVAVYDSRTQQSELLIVPGKDPRWSPDGKYISFVRDRKMLDMAVLASIGHLRVGSPTGRGEVWIMRSDGTEARRLALGSWPSWSPDGNYVFYRSYIANALCKIAAHDRAAQPQQLWETGNGWPSVSPDGLHVAMIFSDTRLCIFDLIGSASQPVHMCDFPDSRFYGGKWSPSGRWFSLAGYDPEKRNGLWIYDLHQRQAKKMLSGPECSARWSPDEKSLVYSIEPPILEIWMADIESLGPGKTFAEHDREMAAHYTQTIQAYPEQTRYYLSRANCYSRLGELEKAIADIEAADRISTQTETRARWLAELKAAHQAGTLVPHGPLVGSMSYDSTTGIYTMVGAGLDIWDNADDFHFAYARLQDDGSITTRIDSLEYVHQWTKAGVMIRNTLDPVSQHGIVFLSPNGRVSFQWRDKEKGITRGVSSEANTVKPPHWVRFIREGNRFTPQHSGDGVQWEAIPDLQDPNTPASVEIPMNETVYVGLAITSHNTTRSAEARMSNVTVTGSVSPSGPFVHSKDITFEISSDNSTNK